MNGLGEAVADYLALRRAVGFRLVQAERMLNDFVVFAVAENAPHLTAELALRWATRPAGAEAGWWHMRLSVIRCFARHLSALDPATEIPPFDLLPRTGPSNGRSEPYIYTSAEIGALFAACDSRRFALTAATCRTIIGLLAVTGMRISEVLALENHDVDLEHAVLTVQQSKFDRSRIVPIHDTTVEALGGYRAIRDTRFPKTQSEMFFVSWSGHRLSYRAMNEHFADLVALAGLEPRSPRCRPRMHDFRHRFAITALEDWYQTDADVQAKLPLLSTFLGHVDPASTYWYLSPKPELLAAAAQRLEARSGGRS